MQNKCSKRIESLPQTLIFYSLFAIQLFLNFKYQKFSPSCCKDIDD